MRRWSRLALEWMTVFDEVFMFLLLARVMLNKSTTLIHNKPRIQGTIGDQVISSLILEKICTVCHYSEKPPSYRSLNPCALYPRITVVCTSGYTKAPRPAKQWRLQDADNARVTRQESEMACVPYAHTHALSYARTHARMHNIVHIRAFDTV